jgi:hypothetical protein
MVDCALSYCNFASILDMLLGWLETLQQATQSMSICDEIFKGWKHMNLEALAHLHAHTQYVY